MTDDTDANQSAVPAVPKSVVLPLLLLALAGAAFLFSRAKDTEGSGKGKKSPMKRVGMMGLITLIENDATRKVVVQVLKAMAKRS